MVKSLKSAYKNLLDSTINSFPSTMLFYEIIL